MWGCSCCSCFVRCVLFSFAIFLLRKRAGCFTLVVFLQSGGCLCSLTPALDAVGLSVVCNCGFRCHTRLLSDTFRFHKIRFA